MTSSWIIALVGVLYGITVITLLYEGQRWMALIFFGYTVAQVGLFFNSRTPGG